MGVGMFGKQPQGCFFTASQSAQRSEEEGMGMDLAGREGEICGERAATMNNGSRSSYRLSIVFLITELVFEQG